MHCGRCVGKVDRPIARALGQRLVKGLDEPPGRGHQHAVAHGHHRGHACLQQLRGNRTGSILGLGGLQVTVTAGLLAAVAAALGRSWKESVAIGLILALSSTAMVLQTLA